MSGSIRRFGPIRGARVVRGTPAPPPPMRLVGVSRGVDTSQWDLLVPPTTPPTTPVTAIDDTLRLYVRDVMSFVDPAGPPLVSAGIGVDAALRAYIQGRLFPVDPLGPPSPIGGSLDRDPDLRTYITHLFSVVNPGGVPPP